jgi:hypothetical protein
MSVGYALTLQPDVTRQSLQRLVMRQMEFKDIAILALQ